MNRLYEKLRSSSEVRRLFDEYTTMAAAQYAMLTGPDCDYRSISTIDRLKGDKHTELLKSLGCHSPVNRKAYCGNGECTEKKCFLFLIAEALIEMQSREGR